MVQVKRTFIVERPLASMIEYFKDFGHAEQWDPGTRSCTRSDEGPVKVGSTWHNVSEFRGRQTELTYRLDRAEERRLTFIGRNKTATSTDDISFEPAGDNTSITYVATINFHGVAKLAEPLLRREFERLGDETQAQITRVANAL